eukprot:scpid7068/ scgid9464/ Myoferlin; Fer-1-like protein 3
MSLTVNVKAASDLPNLERFGKSDPMCSIQFQGKKEKTEAVKGDLNPQWNQSFSFTLGNPLRNDDRLTVQVFDWERTGSNKLMGQCDVNLRECIGSGGMEVDSQLQNGQGEKINAKVQLSISYQAPASQDSGGGDGGGGDADGGDAGDGGGGGGGGFDDGGGDDDDDGDVAPTADEAAGGAAGGAPGVVMGSSGKEGKAQRRAMLRRRKANRAQLPKKPCDFQVRVHVIEARKLVGQNINPVVNVRVWDQVQPTAVKKATNRPLFDQTFYFSFHMAPREFLDKVVTFEVMNSRTLRSDSMIGTFQFDTGLCYDFENHSIIQKWLLLTNPVDPNGGPKGYLKISCSVVGPNDEVKPHPKAVLDDNCDIESNLLRPSGVQLAPATFTVRIYRAEDVPQMDTALFEGVKKVLGVGSKKPKELVDPYVQMNFAGNKSSTSTLYNNANPEFREELKIGCKFPSMCDRIRLRIMDKDNFNRDDTVGTAYLNLSEISAPGETGFLPTFGPCWINVYGSPREYSDMMDEYDYLNQGILEGVAYRARMLVEVTSEIGVLPETTRPLPIEDADSARVEQYFLRRRKFQLRAAFMSGTMVPESIADSPLSFELSIGNYGNELDKNVPPASSTTQPTNPVSDGEYYYYLPWTQSKPCASVTCHWEDVSDRIDSLNVLINICDRLERNVQRVHLLQQASALPAETARAFIDLIDCLRKDLEDPRRKLPEPSRKNPIVTKLDFQIHAIREQELKNILESAEQLRMSATDLVEAMNEVDTYLSRLRNLAFEGQNSVPDVIIWMLSNKKRLAFARIPANEVMYAHHADKTKWNEACGKNCGKPQTVYLKWPPKKDNTSPKFMVAAQLRLVIWLGQDQYASDWIRCADEGEISVFAETYENQANLFGWGKKGVTRPNWSDVNGKMALEQDKFVEPEGWKWNSDWFINPELSLNFSQDSGKSEFLEDIFEYQQRIPGTSWTHSKTSWGNVRGDEVEGGRDEVELDDAWVWKDPEWTLDVNRACDEDGYEYTLDPSMAGYVPVERNYHLCRRRRWVRRRVRQLTDKQRKKMAKLQDKMKEGWEYSRLFSTKFHAVEKKIDMARRRRWHRKLTAQEDASAPLFYFPDADDSDVIHQVTPRMFMTFKEPHKYQLRVYLYQARNVRSADSSGLSDPYARVGFGRQSSRSIILKKTIMPTWDQTLILDDIELYGDPKIVAAVPPDVTIELFDEDIVGKDEFLGRCIIKPYIRLQPNHPPPRLTWHPIKYFGKDAGELLAAFHLMLNEGDELPFAPEHMAGHDELYRVPTGIRPVMQLMRVEALCWGVRDLKRCQLLSVDKPHITITVGGKQLKTDAIRKMKKCPNYDKPLLVFEKVELPREELYMPPLNIQVFDERAFGRTPLVGTHSVINMKDYKRDRFTYAMPLEQKRPETPAVAPSPGAGAHVVEVRESVGASVAAAAIAAPPQSAEPPSVPTSPTSGKPVPSVDDEPLVQLSPGDPAASPQPAATEESAPVTAAAPEQQAASASPKQAAASPTTAGAAADAAAPPTQPQPTPPASTTKRATTPAAPTSSGEKPKSVAGDDKPKKEVDEEERKAKFVDWWSKYYASTIIPEEDEEPDERSLDYLEKYTDRIVVYEEPIEKAFGGFNDFVDTFPIFRGKGQRDEDDEENQAVGKFKGIFCIYPLPEDDAEQPSLVLQNIPPSGAQPCIIRVYVVKATDLQPQDPNGKNDPYLRIYLGKERLVNDKDSYIPNTLDPIFGKMFEIKATLPVEHQLRVQVMDWDLLTADDMIGETTIDLEDRYLTKHRATCGLAMSYCIDGTNIWRDNARPCEILERVCGRRGLPAPTYEGDSKCRVANQLYELLPDDDLVAPAEELGDMKERVALKVLHNFDLVPEHLELRPLYNPLRPNLECGKLQMWVDIFPEDAGIPPAPTNICPRKPDEFELRVIIYNVEEVPLDEAATLTGEMMSDIYLKGWLRDSADKKHKTDVHYRSLNGEGNFNWRWIMPFEYIPAEKVMVIKKKAHFFSWDKTETRRPAVLQLQVWDNDFFSLDDYLGSVEFNLCNMPPPAKTSRKCCQEQFGDPTVGRKPKKEYVSLFESKRLKGWWPIRDIGPDGEVIHAGKVEMEVEILTKDDSEAKPAGESRDDPNQNPTLDPPNRPETSFLWFTSPWKTFKYIIWKNYKWLIIGLFLLILLVLAVGLFLYASPGYSVRKIFGFQ